MGKMATVLIPPVIGDLDQAGVEETREFSCCSLRQLAFINAVSFNLWRIDIKQANFDPLVPERVTVNDTSCAALVRMTCLPEDFAVVRYGRDRSDHGCDQ